jgi:hypothetical protein
MSSSPATMRAVRLSGPGPVGNLRLTRLPLPPGRDGWARIRVEAFGLNRSELKLRLGLGAGVSFPRVPGIEAAGTVDAAPAGAGLARGQTVVAMMGDMGRTYDGGYAEYTSVPLAQVIPVSTGLPWEVLGALPAIPATPPTCPGRPSRRSSTRSRPAGCPSPWTGSTTAWSRCRRPTTTWSTTAPPASSSSASGTSPPLAGGPHVLRLADVPTVTLR